MTDPPQLTGHRLSGEPPLVSLGSAAELPAARQLDQPYTVVVPQAPSQSVDGSPASAGYTWASISYAHASL